jgi:subtilisin-like proprotein convertase family protein
MKNRNFILTFMLFCFAIPASQAFSQQDVFKIKLQIKTERESLLLREMGLDCPAAGECICEASLTQLNRLRESNLPYAPIKRGITFERSTLTSVSGYNSTNYYIHDFDTTFSTINITTAPECALVEGIDISYDIIHSYVGDLIVDLLDEEEFWTYNLWWVEGDGDGAIHDTVDDISYFNGEDVNQTWKLRVCDVAALDTGYIDYWRITIWYQAPADLIVQTLTPSNYNPTAGQQINVTMTVKNQGDESASSFWTDLFFNEDYPPSPPTDGDLWWYAGPLEPGETETHVFTGITNSVAETWHMYGLADSYDYVVETNENNNVKGPVTVMWHEPPQQPDLVIQSLTASNYHPTVSEPISVKLVIKNVGSQDASYFYTDLFENLASPPTVPSVGDYYCQKSLAAGALDSCTFTGITCANVGTWHMYGLVDSDGDISEANESNNVIGPIDVYWQSTGQKPNLIVEDFCIGNVTPEIGESVHVMVTIRNEGTASANGFFSSLYYNRSSPPTPPDIGDDYFYYAILSPGESYSHSFYIGNDESESWSMYSLADSWGSVDESDEADNLWGPEYVTWSQPAKQGPMTRYNIMLNAWEYANVEWTCRAKNALTVNQCSTWVCDYKVDSTYKGVPYLWGGSRSVEKFQTQLSNGYRAGAHLENDCLTENAGEIGDVCWATGIDCSGLTFRCWGMPKYGGTLTLLGSQYSTRIRYDQLMQGDALDDTTFGRRHVVLYYARLAGEKFQVFEARSKGVPPPHPDSNLVQARIYPISYFTQRDYMPIRYVNIFGDPPLTPGDCNHNDQVDQGDAIYILNYLFQKGPPPEPLCIGNVNGDDRVNVTDATWILCYLYRGGLPPQDGCI